MSRRDDLHFPLRRTLEKDGWIITSDPLILVLGETLLKADLGAEKGSSGFMGISTANSNQNPLGATVTALPCRQ